MKTSCAISSFISVSSEIVPLCLDQEGRQSRARRRIDVRNARGNGGTGQRPGDGEGGDATEGAMIRDDHVGDILIHQKIGQIRPPIESLLNSRQDFPSNYTSALPNAHNFRQI